MKRRSVLGACVLVGLATLVTLSGLAADFTFDGTVTISTNLAVGGVSNSVAPYAVAEGIGVTAGGSPSHAEGVGTVATAGGAHAEGRETQAGTDDGNRGWYSHAEGRQTRALGDYSHAEGDLNVASGEASHAEGNDTEAHETASHAEGFFSVASGFASHAEGGTNFAIGAFSHAEGRNTRALGYASHAEGGGTWDEWNYSEARGDASHVEGITTFTDWNAYGGHAEGIDTVVEGTAGHAEGKETSAFGFASHSEGWRTIAGGNYSHAGGAYAWANHPLSYVWSDGLYPPVESTAAGQYTVFARGGIRLLGGPVSGDGSGITNLTAGTLASGTIPIARLSGITSNQMAGATDVAYRSGDGLGNHTATTSINLAGFSITNGTFRGDGGNVTNLSATSLLSGTVPLARLSAITSNQIATATDSDYRNGDNLGNHTASSPINLAGYSITNGLFCGDGNGLTNLNIAADEADTVASVLLRGNNAQGQAITNVGRLAIGSATAGVGALAQGSNVTANGSYSTALGAGAAASHNNTFLWSDGTAASSSTNKEFTIVANNGIRLLGSPIVGNASGLTNFPSYSTMGLGSAALLSGAALSTSNHTHSAADIASGTLGDGRLSTNVSLLGQAIETTEISNSAVTTSKLDLVTLDTRYVKTESDPQFVAWTNAHLNVDVDSTDDFKASGAVAMTGNIKLDGRYLSGDGGDEGVFVGSSGNVGVGTNAPTERLVVAGNVSVSGHAKFFDGILYVKPTGLAMGPYTNLPPL